MRMRWDGTYLGKYKYKEIVKDKFSKNGLMYYKLMIDGVKFNSLMFKGSDSSLCIVDEIKEQFGIEKIGTHSITIGNTANILYRVCSPENIISYKSLNDDEKQEGLRLICFCMIFQIEISRNILIRRNGVLMIFFGKIRNNSFNVNDDIYLNIIRNRILDDITTMTTFELITKMRQLSENNMLQCDEYISKIAHNYSNAKSLTF